MSWGLRNSFCHNRCLPNRQDMSRNRQRGCTFRHSCNCSFSCIANHICRTGIELDTAKKSIKKEMLVLDIMADKLKDLGIWNLESRLFCLAEVIHCSFSYICKPYFPYGHWTSHCKKEHQKRDNVRDVRDFRSCCIMEGFGYLEFGFCLQQNLLENWDG